MIVRRYQGATEEDAIEQAREDLGPGAVILLTKKHPRGERAEVYEVVAAASPMQDEENGAHGERWPVSPSSFDPRDARADGPSHRPAASAERIPDPDGPTSQPPRGPSRSPLDGTPSSWLSRVRQELARDAYGASSSRPATNAHDPLTPLSHFVRDALRTQEVEDTLREAILAAVRAEISNAPNPESCTARAVLQAALSRFVRTAGEIRPGSGTTIIALIGATGVGKTTTIAKLAAHYHLQKRHRVALVTTDSYRIAGEAQLRTYARILGIPCETALTPADLERALQKHPENTVLFLDTPGRSPQNHVRLKEFGALIKVARPTETHLLISATTRLSDMRQIANGFQELRPNRVTFTKLDETSTFGDVVNFAYHTQLPLGYFATGQTVPDALEVASIERLAELLLKQRQLRYC